MRITKFPVIVSLLYQLTAAIPVSLLLYGYSAVAGYSFALGAVIFLLPNTYFTVYAFRYRDVQLARWIARSFSWGESGKLALAAVGFALVFKFIEPLNSMALFAGFIYLIAVQWVIARRLANELAREQSAGSEVSK